MKTKLLIIFILIFWLISCSEENINTIEINKNQKETLTEEEKIKIDEYNFEQLEKAKPFLEKLPKDINKLFTIKEFNEIFYTDIAPVKNCYYISNYNWSENYIFWFQLESEKYRELYWNEYYAYPKYDIEEMQICTWKCYDSNIYVFKETISA